HEIFYQQSHGCSICNDVMDVYHEVKNRRCGLNNAHAEQRRPRNIEWPDEVLNDLFYFIFCCLKIFNVKNTFLHYKLNRPFIDGFESGTQAFLPLYHLKEGLL